MALVFKATGLFESNDDKIYYGVTNFSYNAATNTITLSAASSAASASNFGGSATINLQATPTVWIGQSGLIFPGDSAGTPSA
jgi:hypothetical protein